MSFTVKWQLVYFICSLSVKLLIEYEKTRNKKKKKKTRRIFVEIGLISITAKWTYWIGSIQKVLLFPRKKIKSEYCLLRFPKDPTVFGNYITVIESTFDFIWTKFSVGIFFFQWFLLSLLTVRNDKVLIKVNSFKCLSVRKSVRNRSVRFSTLNWTLTQTLKRFEYIGQNVIDF